jgi:DNA polymerase-3 subunit gamma/tau
LLRLLAFKPDKAAEKKTLKTAEVAPVSAPLQVTQAPSATATALNLAAVPVPVTVDSSLSDRWFEIVEQLSQAQKIQAMTRELALQSQLLQAGEAVWTLQVERESLASPANVDRLQSALQAQGHTVSLKVTVGAATDSPAIRIARQQQERILQVEQEVTSHPLVQYLIQNFDAKIVPGSIQSLSQ